jgi:hypothetical protein
MTFQTYEIDYCGNRREYARHDTFAAAWQALRERPNVVCAEIDADHPECADAFLSNGIVLSIAPIA